MPGVPTTPGRGGGIRLRKGQILGRGITQKRPSLSQNSERSSLAFAQLHQSPAKHLHTATVETYVSYCVLERRKNAKKMKTTAWIKDFFVLLQTQDQSLTILSYDGINSANALTRPDQIPEQTEELNIYFPRVFLKGSSLSTKCKIRSTVPIRKIKAKLMIQLQNKDYWMNQSQLKATRTGKIGWLLGCHPELTHRPEFQKMVKPIIKQVFDKDIEFQVEPENEIIVSGSKRVS